MADLQAGTRAVMVYLALEPQAGLRQGLFGRGGIEVQRKTALLVPLSAVRVDQAQPYVLAIVAGRIERRTVVLGTRGEALLDGKLDGAVEVTSGVTEGTLLLRATAGALRDGTTVRVAAPAASASVSIPASSSASASASASSQAAAAR